MVRTCVTNSLSGPHGRNDNTPAAGPPRGRDQSELSAELPLSLQTVRPKSSIVPWEPLTASEGGVNGRGTVPKGEDGKEEPGEVNWLHAAALDSHGKICAGDIKGGRAQKFVRQK